MKTTNFKCPDAKLYAVVLALVGVFLAGRCSIQKFTEPPEESRNNWSSWRGYANFLQSYSNKPMFPASKDAVQMKISKVGSVQPLMSSIEVLNRAKDFAIVPYATMEEFIRFFQDKNCTGSDLALAPDFQYVVHIDCANPIRGSFSYDIVVDSDICVIDVYLGNEKLNYHSIPLSDDVIGSLKTLLNNL